MTNQNNNSESSIYSKNRKDLVDLGEGSTGSVVVELWMCMTKLIGVQILMLMNITHVQMDLKGIQLDQKCADGLHLYEHMLKDSHCVCVCLSYNCKRKKRERNSAKGLSICHSLEHNILGYFGHSKNV